MVPGPPTSVHVPGATVFLTSVMSKSWMVWLWPTVVPGVGELAESGLVPGMPPPGELTAVPSVIARLPRYGLTPPVWKGIAAVLSSVCIKLALAGTTKLSTGITRSATGNVRCTSLPLAFFSVVT